MRLLKCNKVHLQYTFSKYFEGMKANILKKFQISPLQESSCVGTTPVAAALWPEFRFISKLISPFFSKLISIFFSFQVSDGGCNSPMKVLGSASQSVVKIGRKVFGIISLFHCQFQDNVIDSLWPIFVTFQGQFWRKFRAQFQDNLMNTQYFHSNFDKNSITFVNN